MADTVVESAPVSSPKKAASSPKKTKAATGVKKPVKKPTHPPTSDMVNAAIGELKERKGSSLRAIKKYISSNYKVDAERLAPFIRRYLKNAVESGALVRTKGKGAAGSFKLDAKIKPAKTVSVTGPKKAAKKIAKAEKPAKPTGPKAGGVRKRKVAAKKPAVARTKKASIEKKTAKPKSPMKAKKTAKPPTKPKTPKAKKAVVAKSKPATKRTAKK